MENTTIFYHFEMEDGLARAFEVAVNRSMTPRKGTATWTQLKHHKCSVCPLREQNFSHCPAAVDIEVVVTAFNDLLNHDDVHVVVSLPNGREVHRDCKPAEALSSLLGLILASSACPILSQLKGLALHHLPFASADESMSRFVGAYLIGQYHEAQQGRAASWDLDGLKSFLKQLASLNRDLIKRLEVASAHNPSLVGIRLLLTQSVNMQQDTEAWSEQVAQFGLLPPEAVA